MPAPVSGSVLDPTHDALAALLGSSLHLVDGDDRSGPALTITEVTVPVEDAGWSTWRVTLQGPSDLALDQATYLLRGADGDIWLFLVPGSRDEHGTAYTATFNQPVDGSHS